MPVTTVKHKANKFNHDIASPETPLVNVQIDGTWVQVPKGMNVVEVAKQYANKTVPHYCYHPKLEIVGNCRMCLIEMGTPKLDAEKKPVLAADGMPEIAWMPRPQIGCATQVSEGMGIRTESPLVKECREGVMEFLLINHPLDCPICDQAGECRLQEYSQEYGKANSNFKEEKVKKPKNIDLGERIVLDDERCIMCSRCIRFSKDVSKDNALGFTDRGSFTKLGAHPDRPFNSDYSLNTADICPVGALTSKDFRFEMRVWFLKETKSICTSCGTGCNITIGSRQDQVYRLTPRQNEEVNSTWMCDTGRLNFHYLHDGNRITQPQSRAGQESFPTTFEDILAQTKNRIAKYQGHQIAIIGSARLTNEELYLLKLLSEKTGAQYVDVIPREWQGDDLLKSKDENPNSNGARLLGVSQNGSRLDEIKNKINDGQIKLLVSWQEDAVNAGLSVDTLKKLDDLISVTIQSNQTSQISDLTLPGAGFAEKRGSMINANGRLQRLNKACVTPNHNPEDWEILNDLLGKPYASIEDVFKAMSERCDKFAGLSLSKIGDSGIQLSL